MHPRKALAQTLSLAIHLLAIATLVGSLTLRRQTASREAPQPTVMVVAPAVPPERSDADVAPARREAPGVTGDPSLTVGGFTFDIDRIARRRDLLFPFITGDFTFAHLTRSLESAEHAPLGNPYAPRAKASPPLVLEQAAIQKVTDGAWSRRDRWKTFADVRELLDRYDGHRGAVPFVLRSYLTQNILQPYWDGPIPDPRVWVMLGLSADHIDFIDFIARYVDAHGSTRASTELLFLLDKLVQGSRDSLLALLAIDPQRDAAFTRTANPEAFDLLVSIRQHYQQGLAARGLIRPSPDDMYGRTIQRLATLVDTRHGSDVDARAITALLQADDGRWLMSSYDRLRQFGYRFDTY